MYGVTVLINIEGGLRVKTVELKQIKATICTQITFFGGNDSIFKDLRIAKSELLTSKWGY